MSPMTAAAVPMLMLVEQTLVRVDDDPRTASGPWLTCLLCGGVLETGACYAFAEWGADRGVAGDCCVDPAGTSRRDPDQAGRPAR